MQLVQESDDTEVQVLDTSPVKFNPISDNTINDVVISATAINLVRPVAKRRVKDVFPPSKDKLTCLASNKDFSPSAISTDYLRIFFTINDIFFLPRIK